MTTDFKGDTTVLSAVTATGWGSGDASVGDGFSVRGFRHIIVTIATADSTDATIKFAGSPRDTSPTFANAASVSNQWDYIASYDLEDPSSLLDGDTGIVYSGTDSVRNFIINTDGLDWFNAQVSAYSAGTITVTMKGYNY